MSGPPRRGDGGTGGDRRLRRRAGRRQGEERQVPDADFRSYYGLPILNRPTWRPLDIAGYLFLGGLAGASSALGFGCHRRGLPLAARNAQATALGAIGLSGLALVHDLGRPARFVNMLRTFKVTSPMSIGSWLLSAYAPCAGLAAASAVTGRAGGIGRAAGAGAALLGPGVASYTAVLLGDTAVPAWHDTSRDLPAVFVCSAAMAAAGAALIATPLAELGPARRLGVAATAGELVAVELLVRRGGTSAEPFGRGRAATLLRRSRLLSVAGAACALGARHRSLRWVGGAAWLAASACTRFGVFDAGLQSADDPRYVVQPQRERLERRATARTADPAPVAPAPGPAGVDRATAG